MSNVELIGGTYEADTYCLDDLPVSVDSEAVGALFPDTESDTPTHCAKCGTLIPCRLTTAGKQYVAEALIGRLDELTGDPETVWEWANQYRDEVLPLLDEPQRNRAENWLTEPPATQTTLTTPELLVTVSDAAKAGLQVPYEADPDEVGAYRPALPTNAIHVLIGGALYAQFDALTDESYDIGSDLANGLRKADLHGEDWEVAVVDVDGMDLANWNSHNLSDVVELGA